MSERLDQLARVRRVSFTPLGARRTYLVPTLAVTQFRLPHLLPSISVVVDDILVVSVGEQPATFGTPGVEENCYFMKEVRRIRAARLGCCRTHSSCQRWFALRVWNADPRGMPEANLQIMQQPTCSWPCSCADPRQRGPAPAHPEPV